MCLNTLSKDMEGKLAPILPPRPEQCHTPTCKTLKTTHKLSLKPRPNPPCDTPAVKPFAGTLVVDRLVTAYDQDGVHRGFHAGDFVWAGAAGLQVKGRISGVTNLGTHRLPVFKDCQRCDEKGVMEGRLCGQVVATNTPALKGCWVVAAYRIKFDPTSQTGGDGAVQGVLEGVVICKCQN
jgi:hypothetical protein